MDMIGLNVDREIPRRKQGVANARLRRSKHQRANRLERQSAAADPRAVDLSVEMTAGPQPPAFAAGIPGGHDERRRSAARPYREIELSRHRIVGEPAGALDLLMVKPKGARRSIDGDGDQIPMPRSQ